MYLVRHLSICIRAGGGHTEHIFFRVFLTRKKICVNAETESVGRETRISSAREGIASQLGIQGYKTSNFHNYYYTNNSTRMPFVCNQALFARSLVRKVRRSGRNQERGISCQHLEMRSHLPCVLVSVAGPEAWNSRISVQPVKRRMGSLIFFRELPVVIITQQSFQAQFPIIKTSIPLLNYLIHPPPPTHSKKDV